MNFKVFILSRRYVEESVKNGKVVGHRLQFISLQSSTFSICNRFLLQIKSINIVIQDTNL